jgi:hypothetical protein
MTLQKALPRSVSDFCTTFRASAEDFRCLYCKTSAFQNGIFNLRPYTCWSHVVPELELAVRGLPALCHTCRVRSDRIKNKLVDVLKDSYNDVFAEAKSYEETAETFKWGTDHFCVDPVFFQRHRKQLLGEKGKKGKLEEWQLYANTSLKRKWMWAEVPLNPNDPLTVQSETTLRIIGISPYDFQSVLVERIKEGDKLANDMVFLDGLKNARSERSTKAAVKHIRRNGMFEEKVRQFIRSGQVQGKHCDDLIRFETELHESIYEVYAQNLEILKACTSSCSSSSHPSSSSSSSSSCSSSFSSSSGSSNQLALEAFSASPASVVAAVTEPGKPNGAGSLQVGVVHQPGVPNGPSCLGDKDKIMRGGDGGKDNYDGDDTSNGVWGRWGGGEDEVDGDAAPKESESYKARGDSILES